MWVDFSLIPMHKAWELVRKKEVSINATGGSRPGHARALPRSNSGQSWLLLTETHSGSTTHVACLGNLPPMGHAVLYAMLIHVGRFYSHSH